LRYRAIFLPADLAALSAFQPARLRFEGELNDHPVSLAWQPAGAGRKYAMLSSALLRTIGAAVGSIVSLRFRLVAETVVDTPAELSDAIAANPAARERWHSLTPGRQRGLSAMVNTLARPESRQRKASELANLLATGAELPGPPSRRKTRP
jgi:hypothetical protein